MVDLIPNEMPALQEGMADAGAHAEMNFQTDLELSCGRREAYGVTHRVATAQARQEVGESKCRIPFLITLRPMRAITALE
jgi:hypothetical protein